MLTWWPLTPRALHTASVLHDVAGLLPPEPGTRVEPARFGGVDGEWVRPADDAGADRVLLYFHGGAFLVGSPRTHRRLVAKIVRAADTPALSINYRMFPETDFTGSVADCVEAYRALLDSGYRSSRIVIGGDSAGGTLAFAVVLRAIAAGLPRPAGIFALSPWLDFDSSARAKHPNAMRDAYIPADRFAEVAGKLLGELSPESASPVNARVKQLPPCLIQVSEGELLLHDAELMARRLARAGVPCSLQVWEGRIHVFQAFADVVPEGRQAIAEIGTFVRDVTARQDRASERWRARWRSARSRLRRRLSTVGPR